MNKRERKKHLEERDKHLLDLYQRRLRMWQSSSEYRWQFLYLIDRNRHLEASILHTRLPDPYCPLI